MFYDVGNKIKAVAKIAFYLGLACAGIVFFYFIGMADESYYIEPMTFVLTGSISAAIIGVLSYISSLMIYGFGELVEKVTSIEYAVNKD